MARFQIGDMVVERGAASRTGMVQSLGPVHSGVQFYQVFFGGAAGLQTVAESDLRELQIGGGPVDRLLRGHFDGYDAYLRVILINRLQRDAPLRNNIYAFNASRTKLYPYQFRPLIKLLDSERQRLLICDEVGLGKTIEAGLILTELRARQALNSVLVVCPSGLRAKWQDELKLRFAEEFSLISRADFVAWLDAALEGTHVPPLSGILSIDGLSSDVVLDKLSKTPAPLDLLIVDEAHYARNAGTLRSKGVRFLTQNASAALLLTATPIHLGRENLYTLLSILDPGEFGELAAVEERFRENESVVRAQSAVGALPPRLEEALTLIEPLGLSPWFATNPFLPLALEQLRSAATKGALTASEHAELQRLVAQLNLIGHIYTRARRREVHISPPVRDPRAVTIVPTTAERTFYDAGTEALKDLARSRNDTSGAFTLQMPQRQLASSIHATVRAYRANRAGSGPSPNAAVDSTEPAEVAWEQAGRSFEELLAAWPDDAPDSKYDALVRILGGIDEQSPGAKVVVFAFFKATLGYLRERLARDGIGIQLIDGDQEPKVRHENIQRFQDQPEIRVLLASKVGTEGLDLQFASHLVNYDLPWNPMEVEQRIGRIDRLGQEAKVIHIYSLWVEGTIEERILRRLYERLGVFERSIGDLEAILGEIVSELEQQAFSMELTDAQLLERAELAVLRTERERKLVEQLEDETRRFLGVEAYFDLEISKIQTGRRYVTPEQLRRFVTRFLEAHAPHSRLESVPNSDVYVLHPDQKLRDHLQRHTRAEALSMIGAGAEGHEFTFDGDLALRMPRLDLVNVQHPLIRSITAHYLNAPEARIGAFLLSLKTDTAGSGLYLFRVFRLAMGGVRQHHLLEAVFLGEDGTCLVGDAAEALHGELVERGGPWNGGDPDLDEGQLREALGVAEGAFLGRFNALREEEARVNGALLERRLAGIDRDYERERDRFTSLLQEARGKGTDSRIQRLYEGRLRNLETAWHNRRGDVQSHKEVSASYVEVATGLVRIQA